MVDVKGKKKSKQKRKSHLFPAYPSRTQRQLQLPMLPGNLWRDGKLHSNQQRCTHLSRAPEALHGLLVGEAAQTRSIHLQEPVTWEGEDVMSPSSSSCRKDSGETLPSTSPCSLKEEQGAKLGGAPTRPRRLPT